MRIQELLRQDFANYIRPAFIGCKCEKCGKSKQLELQHVYRFYDMLKDTLEEFNLEYKENSLDYSDDEIKKIRQEMLSKQQKSEYKTLCKECHGLIDQEEEIFKKIESDIGKENVNFNEEYVYIKLIKETNKYELGTRIEYENYKNSVEYEMLYKASLNWKDGNIDHKAFFKLSSKYREDLQEKFGYHIYKLKTLDIKRKMIVYKSAII